MVSPRTRWQRIGWVLIATAIISSAAPMLAASADTSSTSPPIIVVFMENQSTPSFTAQNAPYLTGLEATGRYFAGYQNVLHPSLTNYVAFASGFPSPSGVSAKAGVFSQPSIWGQLTAASIPWAVWQEGMSTTCSSATTRTYTDAEGKDQYVLRHNPATIFSDVYPSNCSSVRDLSSMNPASLPPLSFVTPAICDDMHGMTNDPTYPPDCATGSQALITRGDSWLAAHVPSWVGAGADVVITFDESDVTTGSDSLLTVEVGQGISPQVDPAAYNHYSLLAGLEDTFGVARLGSAATATPLPLAPDGTVSPPPPPPPVVADTFTRPDGPLGKTELAPVRKWYTGGTGTWAIVSDQAVSTGTTSNGFAFVTVPSAAGFAAAADITPASSANAGLVGLYLGKANNVFVALSITGNQGSIAVGDALKGVVTSRQQSSVPLTPGVAYHLVLARSGSTITGTVSGGDLAQPYAVSFVMGASDIHAFGSTAKAGLRSASGDGGSTWDNFTIS